MPIEQRRPYFVYGGMSVAKCEYRLFLIWKDRIILTGVDQWEPRECSGSSKGEKDIA